MRRFTNKVIGVGVLVILALIGSVMNSRQAAAQGPQNGLAVRVVGGDVGIAGTPNVYVNNTTSNPLYIRDLDDPGRMPFQASQVLHFSSAQSNINLDTNLQFPAGYRLVIDHLSVYGEMPVGQKLLGVAFTPSLGNVANTMFIGPTYQGSSINGLYYSLQPSDIFAANVDPHAAVDQSNSKNVNLRVFRDLTAGPATVLVTFFGHLVKLP
jgi:hypothetical protein